MRCSAEGVTVVSAKRRAMPHDVTLPPTAAEAEPIRPLQSQLRKSQQGLSLQNGCKEEPAFRRLCSCSGWPLLVRLVWWALRNDR
jgi:hypothetical protein